MRVALVFNYCVYTTFSPLAVSVSTPVSLTVCAAVSATVQARQAHMDRTHCDVFVCRAPTAIMLTATRMRQLFAQSSLQLADSDTVRIQHPCWIASSTQNTANTRLCSAQVKRLLCSFVPRRFSPPPSLSLPATVQRPSVFFYTVRAKATSYCLGPF